MTDRDYKALLQQRSFLVETISTKEKGIKNLRDYVDRAEANILKKRIAVKDSRVQSVKDEVNAAIEVIKKGVENAKNEILRIEKQLKSDKEVFDSVVKEIETEKKILAGEYFDAEITAIELKNKFRK